MNKEQPKPEYTGNQSVIDQVTGEMVTPEELAKRRKERREQNQFGAEQK